MTDQADQQPSRPWSYVSATLRYSAWVAATFAIATLIVALAVIGLSSLGVEISGVSETTVNVAIGSIMYGLMLLIAIGVPWLVFRQRTTMLTLGLQRLLTWKDIGLSLGGLVAYFLLTIALAIAATTFLDGIDMTQTQDLGGIEPRSNIELLIVFGLLVVIGPIVEEVLFRGYLFGKIRQAGAPFWLTALVVSALFGAVHLQWNVAIDTFALSLVMCLTREATGSLWPSMLMHMAKNSIAFYVLFVSTQSLFGL